ncbi:protein WHAT'S THIS FACTOR 9, mitochondrial isoform X2 [Andrographis paniculata]|uniref:protein WHAT'S THIS FACTOR 9, mitochondrial isoform X2 n=1 Tax=Andrographis paniculata TaxID=175694 RepID=UPI0021E99F27|nr:protein WHAT'S THIS FACTOR 9, mitochondrial isoform X2 [Andrographis paniculata]
MQSQSAALLRHRRRFNQHCGHIRTLYDAVSSIICPRDRGLDHAVEREMHLQPLLNLKNLIISEPSQSVALSVINDSRRKLQMPFRPIDFIRKYPSALQEFHPSSLHILPDIKLTPDIISLNSEETLLYQSVNYKEEIARRLLKLLMLSRITKIPIFVLERLKWELGLPQDYEKAIIPEFPDYFRVIDGKNLRGNGKALELVCWTDELAVSEMEKKGAKDGNIQFPLQYSKVFEMDKKYEKWVDEWQKLPYISPYENAKHLKANSDESDKWAVAVLHELLNLFVGKKAERDKLLFFGEFLGLGSSRFKRTCLLHPGIFYVSNKIRTYTVVLKEAYKRGMLIERHPLVDLRFKYVQLMNAPEDNEKAKGAQEKSGNDVKKGGEELEDVENEEENEADMEEHESDESDDCEDSFDDEKKYRRGRSKRNDAFEERNCRSAMRGRTTKRDAEESGSELSTRHSKRMSTWDGNQSRFPKRMNTQDGDQGRFSRRSNTRDRDHRKFSGRMNTQDGDQSRFSRRSNTRDRDHSKFSGRMNTQYGDHRKNTRDGNQSNFSSRFNTRRDDQNRFSERMNTRDGNLNKFSMRTDTQGSDRNRLSRRMNAWDTNHNSSRTPPPKSNFSGKKARSKTEKFPMY